MNDCCTSCLCCLCGLLHFHHLLLLLLTLGAQLRYLCLPPHNCSRDICHFNDMLGKAVNNVHEVQSQASELRTAYEMGDPNVDITRVMIAAQKSSVSFEALTQVRNRVVRAYEDIMNMPI